MLVAGVSIVGLATGLNSLYEPYPAAAAGLLAQDLVVLLVAQDPLDALVAEPAVPIVENDRRMFASIGCRKVRCQ